MTAVSIGDLSRHLLLRHQMARAKEEMVPLLQEIASENKADVARSLRGEVSELSALEAGQARLSSWLATAGLQASRLSGQQRALDSIGQLGRALWAEFSLVGTAVPVTQKMGLARSAERGLSQLLAHLNTSAGGESLFAGTRSDTAALKSGEVLLSELSQKISGISDAENIRAEVLQWFSDPAGFEAEIYLGGPPRTALRVGEEAFITLSATALAPELRGLLAGAALGALAKGFLEGGDEQTATELMQFGADLLLAGGEALTSLRASIGTEEQHLARVISRNSAERDAVALRQRVIIGADLYEADAALKAVQLRLELIYSLTARLSDLSLLRALR